MYNAFLNETSNTVKERPDTFNGLSIHCLTEEFCIFLEHTHGLSNWLCLQVVFP